MGTAFSGENPSNTQRPIKNHSGPNNKIKEQQSSLIKPLPLAHLYSERLRRERESMTKMGVDLSNNLAPLISEGKIHVSQNNRGIRIDIHDSLLFSPGSAELAATAPSILNEIATLVKENQHLIQVEGHTDNTPIHNAAYFSNWELSSVRASSVVRMLSNLGITDNRLCALGFGSAQPVSENDTPLGRSKNRRVSIMVLYESQNHEDSSLEITPQETNKP
jgi:chemotaxis protein MotB